MCTWMKGENVGGYWILKSTDYDFLATLDVFDDGVMLVKVGSGLQRSSGKPYCSP